MTDAKTKFVIKVSGASMPSSCWGRYVNVGVMEMAEDAPPPKMISERAKGCVRIVAYWGKLHDGSTERSASGKALKEARELVATLEAERGGV